MVKKIRLIEEEIADNELDTQEYQIKMLEYQHAIDWKLWEIYGIVHNWAKREGLMETMQHTSVRIKKKAKSKTDVKSVIIEEDER